MQNLVAWQGFLLPLCLLLFLDCPIALDCDDLLILGRHWVSSGIGLGWRKIDSAHDSNTVSRAKGIDNEEMKDVNLLQLRERLKLIRTQSYLLFAFEIFHLTVFVAVLNGLAPKRRWNGCLEWLWARLMQTPLIALSWTRRAWASQSTALCTTCPSSHWLSKGRSNSEWIDFSLYRLSTPVVRYLAKSRDISPTWRHVKRPNRTPPFFTFRSRLVDGSHIFTPRMRIPVIAGLVAHVAGISSRP